MKQLTAALALAFLRRSALTSNPLLRRHRPQTELVHFPDLKTAIAVQVNLSVPRSTGRSLRAFVLEFATLVQASQAQRLGAPRR